MDADFDPEHRCKEKGWTVMQWIPKYDEYGEVKTIVQQHIERRKQEALQSTLFAAMRSGSSDAGYASPGGSGSSSGSSAGTLSPLPLSNDAEVARLKQEFEARLLAEQEKHEKKVARMEQKYAQKIGKLKERHGQKQDGLRDVSLLSLFRGEIGGEIKRLMKSSRDSTRSGGLQAPGAAARTDQGCQGCQGGGQRARVAAEKGQRDGKGESSGVGRRAVKLGVEEPGYDGSEARESSAEAGRGRATRQGKGERGERKRERKKKRKRR